MKLEIEKYVHRLQVDQYAPSTLKAVKIQLEYFERYLNAISIEDLNDLMPKTVHGFITYMRSLKKRNGKDEKVKKRFGKHTLDRYLYTIKRYLLNEFNDGHLKRDLSVFVSWKAQPKELGRKPITEKDIWRVLKGIDESTLVGKRDMTIVKLLYGTGMRRSELVNLHLEDLNFEDKIIFIKNTKGRKDRVIPMGRAIEKVLTDYISGARKKLLKNKPGESYLFSTWKGEKIRGMTVYDAIRKYFDKANVKGTTHTLRHSFATHLLKNNASIYHIQLLLGHKELSTTEVYTKVYPKELIEVIHRYHPRSLIREIGLSTPLRYSLIKHSYLMRLKEKGLTVDPEIYKSNKCIKKIHR